jgi:hypothetical protein
VDDGRSIDFLDAFENSGFQFIEGLDSEVAQKTSRHFDEQSIDDVQPRTMFRREHVLKAVVVPR